MIVTQVRVGSNWSLNCSTISAEVPKRQCRQKNVKSETPEAISGLALLCLFGKVLSTTQHEKKKKCVNHRLTKASA